MTTRVLEVIVQNVADARAAASGGADRLEIVRRIRDGGLTPSRDVVEAIAAETSLPLRVMVRENAGFLLLPGELASMRRAAEAFKAIGVDGLVLGFARQGRPDLESVSSVLEPVSTARVTFHRAFDTLPDPIAGLEEIAGLTAVDRVLTGGGGGDAAQRCERLAAWARHVAGRLTIIAGGGIDDACLECLARQPDVTEVHIGRLARAGGDAEAPVSAAAVRRVRDILG